MAAQGKERLPSRNVRLTVQYDGTRYAGYQRQSNGITIQGRLEQAIADLTGETPTLIAAARTDAGVHALGQVVNFGTATPIPTDRLPLVLNTRLPADIVVAGAATVPASFHARFQARAKVYRYTIDNGRFPSPLSRLYAYHIRRPLDVAAMQEAALLLVGRHDFAAFRATGGSAKTSVRTIWRLRVEKEGPLVQVKVAANGFLYNMVRIIAGTLVEVGEGRLGVADVKAALATGQRERAGRTLPPQGLTLMSVHYEDADDAFL